MSTTLPNHNTTTNTNTTDTTIAPSAVKHNGLMNALVKKQPGKGITLDQVPIPKIGAHEVLIKIAKTAICGTDLHIYKWDQWAEKTIKTPMHVGHEFVGHIVEIGTNVQFDLKIGDRVSGEGHIICGQCHNCRCGELHLCAHTVGVGVNRVGAFAEYLAIPAFNVYKVPPHISDNVASMLDPLGNAVHTALCFDLVAADVLIVGAGPIGCMASAICKQVGARNVVVIDINQYRLDLAKQLGATKVINIAHCANDSDQIANLLKGVMHDLNIDEGFSVSLEMSGINSAISAMLKVMMNGAKIAMLGISSKEITMDWNKIVFGGLTLKGIYGRRIFQTWQQMSALIEAGLDVSKIITHVLPFNDYLNAFQLLEGGECGKVVLDWSKA